MKRRTRVIAAAAGLSMLSVTIIFAATFYLAYQQSIRREETRLTEYAKQLLLRNRLAYKQAYDVLVSANKYGNAPCTPEHIFAMQQLTMGSESVKSVGYYEHKQLTCTSWGPTRKHKPWPSFDYVTAEHVGIAFSVTPLSSPNYKVMELALGSYSVLVDSATIKNIIVIDPDISLAITNIKGGLLGKINLPDDDLISSLTARKQDGTGSNEHLIYSIVLDGDWMAIATKSRNSIFVSYQQQQIILFPIVLIFSACIVGLIIWRTKKRLSLQGELEQALRNRSFQVHYQPIMDLESGLCVGAEALIRWPHGGKWIPPDRFIPLAERTGQIKRITNIVAEIIAWEMKEHLEQNPAIHIAINLCPEDFHTGRAMEVSGYFEDLGINPQQIWFEATERGFMDIENARTTLSAVKSKGHKVSIDDFGTGYSSLQYLQNLPIDTLKIDKSFVNTICRDTATSLVTSHIIGMAKSLRLLTVAEGVETQEQVEYLKEKGVNLCQGWLYSKALPCTEFMAFFARTNTPKASPEVDPLAVA